MNKIGILTLIFTAFILGTFGILIRELTETFTNSGSVFARSFAALVIISLILLIKRTVPFTLEKKNVIPLLFFCVTFPISIILFTISVDNIKVSNSLFMLYVGSIFSTLILGKILVKEKFTINNLIALILVCIGLTVFIFPFNFGDKFITGTLFGILGGIFEGSSHILRRLMKNIKREVVVFYQSLSGVIVSVAVIFASQEGLIRNFSLYGILVAAGFGVLLVSIGYLLFYGFNKINVNLGAIILSTELFFAVILNAIFLSESPTGYELIGGMLIFLGSATISIDFDKLFKLKTKKLDKKM